MPASIFQLRRERNEIRDAIAAYEIKLREARADLAAVLSTLRLYELAGDPIQPISTGGHQARRPLETQRAILFKLYGFGGQILLRDDGGLRCGGAGIYLAWGFLEMG